jgi:hypothetical protein
MISFEAFFISPFFNHFHQLIVTATKGHEGKHGWVAMDEFVFLTGQGPERCSIEPPLASPEGYLL